MLTDNSPKGFVLLAMTLISTALAAQYSHTVIPVGNFADVRSATKFSQNLYTVLDDIGGNQTILFTGDVLAGSDMPENFARIDTILGMLKGPNRKFIFIPGDRDWDASGQSGWEMALDLEGYLRFLDRDDVLWPLKNGCPGPERVELDLGLSLLVVNTQWWNHPFDKPTPESAMCEIATHEEAFEEIEKIVGETLFGNILIAGHYPVISGGEYGGNFPLGKWLFPVPVVSTMITSHRQNIGTPLHIVNERYTEFREEMEDILSEYPSMVYLSGHEACREIIPYSENILIQSGNATDAGYVDKASQASYASAAPGLIAIHYDMEGNVRAAIYDLIGNKFEFDRHITLLQAPCKTPLRNVTINQRLVPCLEDKYVLPTMTGTYPAMEYVAAGPQYAASGFKKFLLGTHYRETWTTPVGVSYLDLDHYAEGLIPYLKGGGRQTKSLRMRGEDGREYVFRSVDKDPSRALSYNLRETLISLVVKDQTSTQHPYGALATSRLLDNTTILHPRPQLYLMPNDDKLGPFKETFGNVLGMIEERPSGRKSVQATFGDADEIRSSTELFRELYKDPGNRVNSDEFIQARVFDILVGDWSKHEDNWKWAGYAQSEGIVYRPIPRDRDHVFSLWDGVLPWIVDREWAKPQGEHFGYHIRGLRSLMWQARHLDRLLANAATLDDWKTAARALQEKITTATIDSAVATLPDDIPAETNAAVSSKLRERLAELEGYATQYYSMLARRVDIPGSNQAEHFDIIRNPDGSLDVSVFEIAADTREKSFYHRTFLPGETQEVRVYGLQGDDHFTVRGDSKKSILLRVIPGSGKNTISDQSSVSGGKHQTRIYTSGAESQIESGTEAKVVHIPYPEAYRYRRTSFAYHTYTPLLYAFFSSGNGFSVGGGVSFTRQSYDKPDYSAIHRLMLRASTLGNLRFEYDGKLRYFLGTWDFTYGILLDKHQRLNYFFGTGNETTLDPDLLLADYYTLQYSEFRTFAGLSRSFWDRSHVEVVFTLIGTGKENLENNILEPGTFPDVAGQERLRVAKLHTGLDLDFRDRPHLPERGMRLTCVGAAGKALNDTEVDYINGKATLEYFGTVKPFTLGLKLGGAVHDGITPFFDFHYLGQNTHLRGYRQNRFTGKSLAFFNSDLRVQLINSKRALIPFKLGLLAFFDTGKVFETAESAPDPGWHMGYGGGLYFVPLRERFAIQISMGFSEEESGLLRFGIGQSF